MKICHFDAFAGIAGDMTVGALLDAGADAEALCAGLDSLATGARFRIEKVKRHGIAATQFHIDFEDQKKHRHLPHIVKMIEASSLPAPVQRDAVRVFETLGRAESTVHGTPIEKVHFHEVGAVDSICDIAGACYGLHLLGVERISCSAINTGSGTVNTEHGVMPVPAPATALLLEGKPVYARGPAAELTTPTGAALVAALATHFGPMPAMRIERSGFGAGTKDFAENANVLRLLLGQASSAAEATSISVLEANLDDTTPQVLGYAMDKLFRAGALDVTLQPLLMKKQRPGVLLRVLANPEDQEKLAAIVFAETTTFGLRLYPAERRVEERRHVEVETPYGKVRVKVAANGTWAPEYEDCRALAEQSGKPLKEILAAAGHAYLASVK